jgi:Helicase conserved C-terminal domain
MSMEPRRRNRCCWRIGSCNGGASPLHKTSSFPLAKQLVGKGEKLLVFRNMRGPAQGCARYLSKELGLAPAAEVIAALPTQDLTGASRDLRECLQGGTAFHNTNLLRAERDAIERRYRDRNSGIHVLAATTTLAAGINTPASTVVLAENEFVGDDGRPFTIAEYKNMAGRAGRLGDNEIGKAIILADTPVERAQLFQKYELVQARAGPTVPARPERANRTGGALVVDAFFMGAADNPVGHDDRLGAGLGDERQHLFRHMDIIADVGLVL